LFETHSKDTPEATVLPQYLKKFPGEALRTSPTRPFGTPKCAPWQLGFLIRPCPLIYLTSQKHHLFQQYICVPKYRKSPPPQDVISAENVKTDWTGIGITIWWFLITNWTITQNINRITNDIPRNTWCRAKYRGANYVPAFGAARLRYVDLSDQCWKMYLQSTQSILHRKLQLSRLTGSETKTKYETNEHYKILRAGQAYSSVTTSENARDRN
jgi:hypothetical protein